MSNSLYERRNRKMAWFADRGLLGNYVFYRAVVGQITGLLLPLMLRGRRPNKDQNKGGQRGSGTEPSLGVPLLPLGSETRHPFQMHCSHSSWACIVTLLMGCAMKTRECFRKFSACTAVQRLTWMLVRMQRSGVLSEPSILFVAMHVKTASYKLWSNVVCVKKT